MERGNIESKPVGEIILSDSSTIRVSTFEGRDGVKRVDIRLFVKSSKEGRYSGPTKKGIVIPLTKLPELVKLLQTVR